MANSSCGNEPELDKFKEHQPECEAVQLKESDKAMPINAAEQGAVSLPVVIQDNALIDKLESANVHGSSIDAALFVVLPEVKQTNITTAETEEHSTDIKNEAQDQRDLGGPIINLHGTLDKMEDETRTTPSPEPQTSKKDQNFQNPSHEHFLYLNGEDMLVQQIEETRIDPTARDDHPESLSDTILEHVEETCVGGEIQLQATDEAETLEPPAKKRLRKRMGMCGLGDKKRKLLFDGQNCRQGLIGIHRGEEVPKCNNVVQHLYNTVLKNNDTTLIDHEGICGPECDENGEEVLVLETSNAALMDDVRTEEAEKENRYALSKCTALMSDNVTTDESPKANGDVLKKGILDENNETIIMHDKGTDEQVIFVISTGMVETPPSSTMGKKFKMIQDELSVADAASEQGMETAICGEKPNFSGIEMTNIEQDFEFNTKLKVLSEKQNHRADIKLDKNPDEIATKVEVAQDVSSSPMCATVETAKGSVIASKGVIQAVPTGLEASEIEIEKEHPPSLAASEKHDPNGIEICKSSEKGLHPPYVDNTSILVVTSTYETQCAKRHEENDKSMTAVSDSAEPARGDAEGAMEISEPLAPPTGQENHIQCFLDQKACDTSVTPTVAEQQVCNPTLTPAASELPQETDLSVSPWLYSLTDSQIHKIALSMELEDQPVPESCDQPEDATELVRGLVRELSSLNRTVMAAHREMELLHRGKHPKAPNRRLCGPHNTEKKQHKNFLDLPL